MSTEHQDDQVITKLYKEGAKETPPPKLDQIILNYAASKNKRSSSYFSGGWKVPVSLAASITIVFAIIMQIEKMPDQIEIPQIPASGKTDNQPAPVDESSIDAKKRSKAKDAPARREDKLAPMKSTKKNEVTKKLNQHQQLPQSQALEEELQNFDSALSADEAEAGALTSPESVSTQSPKESSIQKRQKKFNVAPETDTSKLPVEDWLLLIEQLIAKKDYAEARRQLDKFKVTHTKVNVEELENLIP